MGIKGSNKLLYVTKNVCPLSLRQIALARCGGDTQCRIVIDCFWLAMKLMALTGLKITPSEVGAAVAEMMIMIVKEGFIVTPVCDPPNHRHHTKQASIERVVQREKARVEGTTKRCELMEKSQKLANANDGSSSLSTEEIANLKEDVSKLSKRVKTLENKAESPIVPPTFIDDLKATLKERDAHEEDEEGCKVEEPLVSSFQADSVIAKRAKDGKSHLIMSPDTDFMAHLGKDCVTVRNFSISKEKNKKTKREERSLSNFEICSCALEMVVKTNTNTANGGNGVGVGTKEMVYCLPCHSTESLSGCDHTKMVSVQKCVRNLIKGGMIFRRMQH